MRPRLSTLVCAAACLAFAALLTPAAAQAHFLVGREDLPIPAWLFAWGASLVLIISFFLLSLAWRRSRFETEDWHPVSPTVSRIVLSKPVRALAAALSLFLFGVLLWTGFHGTGTPDLNFSLTFIFVTVWLGVVIASVLLGDVFRALNPWRWIAIGVRAVLRLLTGQEQRAPFTYPERWGRWPAVAGIVGFLWLELIQGSSGLQSVGVEPRTAAVALLVYTVWTLAGMALFGIETWLARGEAFSVYFEMFSRLSVFEVRDGRLGRRRFLSGTVGWADVPGSLGLVIVTIAGTTFDGAQEGLLSSPISSLGGRFLDWGMSPGLALRLDESIYFALTIAFVGLLYWLGTKGMHLVRNSPRLSVLRIDFAHTLIPIALAYLTAHYFSLVVYQEQAQFTYLLSDPLGNGSNFFGTVTNGVDFSVITPRTVWYVQVAALIVGHVIALSLAHDKALAVYGDSRLASLSQRWMLLVMVGFTCLGLYLLSEANG